MSAVHDGAETCGIENVVGGREYGPRGTLHRKVIANLCDFLLLVHSGSLN